MLLEHPVNDMLYLSSHSNMILFLRTQLIVICMKSYDAYETRTALSFCFFVSLFL